MVKLILVSGSPRRRKLVKYLKPLIKNIIILKPQSKEIIDNNLKIDTLVILNAKNKLNWAIERSDLNRSTIMLAADTMVEVDGKPLGKPSNYEEAFKMIKQLSGKWHTVTTGYVIKYNGIILERVVKTDVFVDDISNNEIEEYINNVNVFDAAGAYKIQGIFRRHILSIKGNFDNVIGFPVAYIYKDIKSLILGKDYGNHFNEGLA